MKLKVEQPVAVICTFVWIGFICAISFLEAWMKFRAPGVTLPIGLGIGRLVFGALNKIEWVFAIAILVSIYTKPAITVLKSKIPLLLTIVILATQTIWLLPALDARAELHITGQHVAPSNLHIYYVIAEFVKVIALTIFGIKLFQKS
jgi:uncharacterized membrane protein (DUF485 family)